MYQSPSINEIRQQVVTEAFATASGERSLIFISSFPFICIGTILKVESDYVFLDIETKNRIFFIVPLIHLLIYKYLLCSISKIE